MRLKTNCLKILFLFVFINIYFYSLSQNATSISGKTEYLTFNILESELSEGKYINGNIDSLGFHPYNKDKIPNTRPKNDRMITLRSEIIIDSSNINQNLYLVTLPIDYACRIYFNGKVIAIKGNTKNGYTNRIHYTEKTLLSNSEIIYNQKNEIAYELYPKEGEINPFIKVFISDSRYADKYVFRRNFFGSGLIFSLSICSIVFFIFFLFTYISRREFEKWHFLYFAFMNLFLVVSYINNIVSFNYANTFILEKIARAGFPIFIFVGCSFMIDYTNVLRKKRLFKIILLLVYLPALIMVLIPNTITGVIKAYNSYPLIVLLLGNFILFALSFLFYLKEKNLLSLLIFIAMLLNLFAGFHDGYIFAILKSKPFVLLVPIAVFLINLIIFIVIIVDYSKSYHLAIKSSDKLKILNENLGLVVEERTKKIIDYSNKLEVANNTKDKFFSIIAHDLKNPFNTLIGYSELLKNDFRELADNEISKQLNIIFSTSKNGYALLDNLLQWAQSQTNIIQFKPVKIKLRKLVQECIENIENQSKLKEIEIINNVPEKFEFTGDENQLKTILRNLIYNAVKFTSRNGLIIIKSEKTSSDILISVKDTGIGISEVDIKNLFKIEKLFSKSGTNNEKGSGLGLILCKEFIEKQGGRIWVESVAGYGSEFKFILPVFKKA